MNENDVRKIVQDEVNRQRYQTGAPVVLRHLHDGIDSPQIAQNNVIPVTAIDGAFPMTQNTTYTFKLLGGQIPRTLNFYGGALNTTASPKIHALCNGQATFGANQEFQPDSTTSVKTGPVVVDILQGSSALVMYDGASPSPAATSILRVSGGYIVYVTDASNNIYARAKVISYSSTSIQVEVILATNWSINGYWLVT